MSTLFSRFFAKCKKIERPFDVIGTTKQKQKKSHHLRCDCLSFITFSKPFSVGS